MLTAIKDTTWFKNKLEKLTQGTSVVMCAYELDVLDEINLPFEYRSILNPNRIGIKDTYLVTKME